MWLIPLFVFGAASTGKVDHSIDISDSGTGTKTLRLTRQKTTHFSRDLDQYTRKEKQTNARIAVLFVITLTPSKVGKNKIAGQ